MFAEIVAAGKTGDFRSFTSLLSPPPLFFHSLFNGIKRINGYNQSLIRKVTLRYHRFHLRLVLNRIVLFMRNNPFGTSACSIEKKDAPQEMNDATGRDAGLLETHTHTRHIAQTHAPSTIERKKELCNWFSPISMLFFAYFCDELSKCLSPVC